MVAETNPPFLDPDIAAGTWFVHHDREFARAGGHEDIFFNTGFTRAALGRMLGDYVDTDGWPRRLDYSMRRMNRPGDTIRARGKVTRKYLEDDGTGLLDLDVWLENSREGTTTPGKATVMLPTRPPADRSPTRPTELSCAVSRDSV